MHLPEDEEGTGSKELQPHDKFCFGWLPSPAERTVTNISGHVSINARTGDTGQIGDRSREQSLSFWGKLALSPDLEAVDTQPSLW